MPRAWTEDIQNSNSAVVLNGYETWSLALREERRLRVFENRVLRRLFGPTRGEVPREWRKLHNEELNDLYSLSNIIRVTKSRPMRLAGHVTRMGVRTCACRVLVENLRERSNLEGPDIGGRIILRWSFKKWDGGMDWIDMAQVRKMWPSLINAVINLRVP